MSAGPLPLVALGFILSTVSFEHSRKHDLDNHCRTLLSTRHHLVRDRHKVQTKRPDRTSPPPPRRAVPDEMGSTEAARQPAKTV